METAACRPLDKQLRYRGRLVLEVSQGQIASFQISSRLLEHFHSGTSALRARKRQRNSSVQEAGTIPASATFSTCGLLFTLRKHENADILLAALEECRAVVEILCCKFPFLIGNDFPIQAYRLVREEELRFALGTRELAAYQYVY